MLERVRDPKQSVDSVPSVQNGDEALGLNDNLCRRDFLNAALAGSGSILLTSLTPGQVAAQQSGSPAADWDGPGGVGDYRNAHGNSWNVTNSAHTIRDGKYDRPAAGAVDTGEVFDCVVVGGGLSRMASALFFSRDPMAPKDRTCLILENHPLFGGAARRNEFEVDGQRLMAPQGATQFPVPFPNVIMDRFYRAVGFNYWEFEYQSWGGAAAPMPLTRTVYALEASMPPLCTLTLLNGDLLSGILTTN